MPTRAGVIALISIGGGLGAVVAAVLYFSVRHLSDHQSAAVLGLIGATAGTLAFAMSTWRYVRTRARPRR